MVSEDTWLNKNSILILNFFFIAFILQWKSIFLIMGLLMSFPDDIEVSLSQLKRFNEPVIDPEFLLNIAATSDHLTSDLIIICFRRFLLRCGFWSPHNFFVFLRECLSKIETKLFFIGCTGSHSRHTIKNIQFKLITIILFEIAVYWFLWFKLFKFCFENSIYQMMMITQTIFKGICRHEWKFRICN